MRACNAPAEIEERTGHDERDTCGPSRCVQQAIAIRTLLLSKIYSLVTLYFDEHRDGDMYLPNRAGLLTRR